MSNNLGSLLDACLESREADAIALIKCGRGLRHYCSRRGIEPLVACAKNGLGEAFQALIENSFYDPHESTLDEAMREAAAHGHEHITLAAWRIGASLDYEAIDRAIDNGHVDALERLLGAGAIEAGEDREGFPSEADYLMHAYCARGHDELAAACIQRGARLDGSYACEAAMNIAANRLVRTASAWLAEHGDPPQAALQDWSHSFPALMQSRLDKLAIQGHVPPQAGLAPKARL